MPTGPGLTAALGGYLFYEIAALLVLAAGVGFVGLFLRQLLIVSFIAVPSVLGIARSNAEIDLPAELGIAVLLFLVGLELDLNLVRTLGPMTLVRGGAGGLHDRLRPPHRAGR